MTRSARQSGLSRPELYQALGEVLSASSPPQFTVDQWHSLIRFSGDALIAAQLYEWLASRGQLSWLSEDIQLYLQEVSALNTVRVEQLIATFSRFAKTLNEVNVHPIAIKGISLLLSSTSLSSLITSRITYDVDALIPPSDLQPCLKVLSSAGYRQLVNPIHESPEQNETQAAFKDIDLDDFRNDAAFARAHVPPFIDQEGVCAIDLHTKVVSSDTPRAKALTQLLIEQSTQVQLDIDEAIYQIPSPAARLVLAVYHAQIKNDHQFLGLVDWRLLFDLHATLIDHPELELVAQSMQLAETVQMGREMFTAWALTEQYLGSETEVYRFETPAFNRSLRWFNRRCHWMWLSWCCWSLVRLRKACELVSPKELRQSLGNRTGLADIMAHLSYRIRRNLKS